MESIGPRQARRSGQRTLAASLGTLLVIGLGASLACVALTVRRTADREAAREAELDQWAGSAAAS